MHILIVEDETPAREELRYILEALAPEATFDEATNGEEALALIENESIQVVFLDIHLPGLDGMAVAATIMDGPEPPLIVFATAYDQHALQAFDLAALDYVVKPFDEQRLTRTMGRVRQAFKERAMLEQIRADLREYLSKTTPGSGVDRLWGERRSGNRVLIDYQNILWLVAEDKKVYANTTAREKLLVHHTLKELEARLSQHGFVMVHKAYLANLRHVAEIVPWFSGNYLIRMADEGQTEIPLSRRYAAQLKKLTGWR